MGLLEASAVKVDLKKQRLVVVVKCVPRKVDKMEFVRDFDEVFERLPAYHLPIILCDDIRKLNKLAAECESATTSNILTLKSDLPTRITKPSSSCVDHFVVIGFHNASMLPTNL